MLAAILHTIHGGVGRFDQLFSRSSQIGQRRDADRHSQMDVQTLAAEKRVRADALAITFAHGNGAGIAVLWTARGIGSFAGPFAAFRLAGTDDRGLRRSISGAFALLAVCYVGFAVSPAIGYAAVALAIANAGGSILWTSGSTLLQRMVPDAVRGRVAAAEIGGFMLTLSASTLATGLLLDRAVPARALMAACGLVALLPLAYWTSAQRAFEVTGQGAGE